MNRVARYFAVIYTLLSCWFCSQGAVVDWAQFRHDAGRTAVSPEQLSSKLRLHWMRELPGPQPDFPSEVRLRFDASYEPVVLRQKMFVPLTVTDSINSLGNECWRFFIDGPACFAPMASLNDSRSIILPPLDDLDAISREVVQ